jgi:hypothetical protein
VSHAFPAKNSWQDRVRRQIFPPNCSRPDCWASGRIWRRPPMILVDGHWVCSPKCLEASVLSLLEPLCASRRPYSGQHRVPLGLLMLSRAYINEQQLQTGLAAQREAGFGRFGAWAVKLQFVTERQILTALSLQWSCPVLALQAPPDLTCSEMLPWNLLRSLRMMPVRFVRSTHLLYMAVCDPIEHASLAAIEQMLRCRVVPCLVGDRTMHGWLESDPPRRASRVQVFEKTSGAEEIARIMASYAGRLGAEDVRLIRCGPYVWVRLGIADRTADLLFRIGPAPLHHMFGPADELVAAAG